MKTRLVQDDRPGWFAWSSDQVFLWLRFLSRKMLKRYFVFSVRNEHNLPAAGPFIVTANHVSFMDSVVLQAACPHRIVFLMTRRYYDPLLVRWFFHFMYCIPLNENTPYNIAAVRKGLKFLTDGNVVGIFPEGGISQEGVLRPGMPGTLLLAQKAGVPILPAYIDGTFQALPRHARFFRNAKICVSLGEPLAYAALSEGLPAKRGLQAATKNLMDRIGTLAPAAQS